MSAAGTFSSRRSSVQESTSVCRCHPYVPHFLDPPEQLSPMSRRQDSGSRGSKLGRASLKAMSTTTGPCASWERGSRAAQKEPHPGGVPMASHSLYSFSGSFYDKEKNCSQQCSGLQKTPWQAHLPSQRHPDPLTPSLLYSYLLCIISVTLFRLSPL